MEALILIVDIILYCLTYLLYAKLFRELDISFDGRISKLEKEVFEYGSDYRRDNKNS